MIKGKITISRIYSNSDNLTPIRISIHDSDAGIEFATINMSLEDFAMAITGLGYVDCSVEVNGLEHVGKLQERNEIIFEMPKCSWKEQKEIASQKADEVCPEGWIASNYFGSQNSFFFKDGKEYARTNIMRWVDKKE